MGAMIVPRERRRSSREVESLLHDLRGPLTVIRGQCHAIVRAGGRRADLIPRLRVIDAEVERIARTIDRARSALHGAEAGEVDDVIELGALLRETLRRHEGSAGEAGVELRIESHVARAEVVGRLPDLRRLLDNLLTNAIRHARYGSAVTITCASDGRTCELSIANEDRHGSESPDWRRTPGERRAGHGTAGWGIGLAIVDDIATGHHGRLDVRPSAAGTVVSVALPSRGTCPAVPA